MIRPFQIYFITLGLFGVLGSTLVVYGNSQSAIDAAKGAIIYERSCLMCHGVSGKGDGPAAFCRQL
jgi:mono/diheme cytochrome c family protein